jgi:hypothetical protein
MHIHYISEYIPPSYAYLFTCTKQILIIFRFCWKYMSKSNIRSYSCSSTNLKFNIIKSIIPWDMTLCSLLSVNRRFGGTYRLHLQGRKNRFSKPASKTGGKHSVMSQKMILFITTTVKTSNYSTLSVS